MNFTLRETKKSKIRRIYPKNNFTKKKIKTLKQYLEIIFFLKNHCNLKNILEEEKF